MFAAVRAAYNIPRDENLKLRDFPTLAHVIQFARQGRTHPIPGHKCRTREVPVTVPRPDLASFDAANRIPRRVPVPEFAAFSCPSAKRQVSRSAPVVAL